MGHTCERSTALERVKAESEFTRYGGPDEHIRSERGAPLSCALASGAEEGASFLRSVRQCAVLRARAHIAV